MVVVIFHNEIRYRSTLLPFALAGAAGGWALLRRRDGSAGACARPALGLGLVRPLVVAPYAGPGGRGSPLPARPERDARAAEKGDAAAQAASRRGDASGPRLRAALAPLRACAGPPRRSRGALAAYETARGRRAHVWVPSWCVPRFWPRRAGPAKSPGGGRGERVLLERRPLAGAGGGVAGAARPRHGRGPARRGGLRRRARVLERAPRPSLDAPPRLGPPAPRRRLRPCGDALDGLSGTVARSRGPTCLAASGGCSTSVTVGRAVAPFRGPLPPRRG